MILNQCHNLVMQSDVKKYVSETGGHKICGSLSGRAISLCPDKLGQLALDARLFIAFITTSLIIIIINYVYDHWLKCLSH